MGPPLPILADKPRSIDRAILQLAFDSSPEGMALTEGGVICYANSAFAKLVGQRNPADLQGKSLADFRPRGYPCSAAEGVDARRVGKHHLCHFVVQKRGGATLKIESSCGSFLAGGREFQWLTVRDVSLRERRRMVRDQDRRFRTMFEAAPMGIVQCDLQGLVLESNPAVEKMLGYTRDELRGMHFRQFTHPDDIERDLHLFQELVAGQREAYDLEVRYVGKGPVTGWVRLHVSLIRTVDGEPQFAIGMTEDVTERKRAEQRLREAQKMEVIGRLVGGVAHDFNNLLTGIMLYCDLLIGGLEPGSRLMHHAEEIRMAGQQGSALIQQLLAISRRQVVEPKILCLNEAVLSTRNLLSRLLGEKFQLETRLNRKLGKVKIDPAQVQQILLNLVLNARDAMPQGGTIRLSTGHAAIASHDASATSTSIPCAFLEVTDTGCGMSAETQSHLFEPFFTTKSDGRGTGLGLATVYSIVTNNGGMIRVESAPQEGTSVTVLLPLATKADREMAIARHSPAEGGETVLLLEDNVSIRRAAGKILKECGYVILEAGSGEEAIALSREHAGNIDLLLADVDMPGMNGHETASRIRTEQPELRVLYVSGDQLHARAVPGDGDPVVFFKKPFTGAALLEKLREILESEPRRTAKKSAE